MVKKSNFAHGEFCFVDLVAHDMAAAGSFYSEVFGWDVVTQDTEGGPPYAMFEIEGDMIAGLGEMSPEMKSQGIPPMWNSYVSVDDIDATVAKAGELGANVIVPVMQVMNAGKLAFILDPGGASLGFWQALDSCGSARIREPGGFTWNERASKDIEKARAFYGKLLGWDFEDHPSSPSKYYIIKDGDENRGGLMQMTEEWGEVPSHWTVYFDVENVDETVTRHENAGGSVRAPAFDAPGVGRIAILADAQGAGYNLLKLEEQC
ncbi:MAG: VOC family protein [Planctomycetota bacterium]|jgi:predicted enzyme related to lactoylglutathione lyase